MSELLTQEFFAPAYTDLIDTLIGQYRGERAQIERVCEVLHGDGLASVMHYFLTGNGERHTMSAAKLFEREGAIAALNAHYWRRAMELTDVLDCMPAKRREEWFEAIQGMTTPDFEDQVVRDTLAELLAMRGKFLAERVDGIFQALSRTHVTNRPEGFSKRMILTGVTNDYGSYGREKVGHVNDLRAVVAKLMRRDEPDYDASNKLVEVARAYHRGEWLDVDGGALRLRCYLNGNAHLEVHEDIAWQLNQILAMLHPAAIPSRFRTKPKRSAKRDHILMERPLPFAVIRVLANMRPVSTAAHRSNRTGEVIEPLTHNKNSLEFGYGDRNKYTTAEIDRVLSAIGGVRCRERGSEWYEFDYDPRPVLGEVIASGCVPDHKSHQYYPTPPDLAAAMVAEAEIGDGHSCLEPSAGTGAIADLMPKDRTQCVEVSALHAKILEQKGHTVHHGDFLAFAEGCQQRYDRIVMNPPFSLGRWQAHVEAAAGLLAPDGRLVALLPESARRSLELPGFKLVWRGPYENQFAGTSVSVVMLTATRECTPRPPR